MYSLEDLFRLVQKPGRYTGGELNSVIKDNKDISIRFAFCFPDLYEVGMSHLGMKILYGLLNEQPDIWCERVFMPDIDMEALMRENQTKLFSLESRDAIDTFDFLGFTLQYELSFTAILNMLDLAGLPLHSSERDSTYPLVIGGGPCACNPEPIADFFDIFVLGEGEEVTLELTDLYRRHKAVGYVKATFLLEAAQIEGVYVPSLYDVNYNGDGTIESVIPHAGAPVTVRKRIIKDLNTVYYPESFVVPFIDIVHDRAMTEGFRGCIRGCRFCQAGFIYRPVREKSSEVIDAQSRALCENTGYEEFSLTSLSTGDYTQIERLLPMLLEWAEKQQTNISLPSLRIDSFSEELAAKLNVLRRSGLTFAPEAGTQRLRDAINKNLSEDEILGTVGKAFSAGWTAVKLYFMMGLPTETLDDVAGIAALGQKIVDCYYNNQDKPKGKSVNVSVSAACFVPKPFTPFQWEPQDTVEMLGQKQKHLRSSLTTRKITFHWHDASTSYLEGVIARGDRRLCGVMEEAFRRGCKRDSWSEYFNLQTWLDVMADLKVDPAFYANRRRDFDEVLPWDHLDYGVSKEFLKKENLMAHETKPPLTADRLVRAAVPPTGKEGYVSMKEIRIRFRKIGRAKFISHLDLTRTMTRAVRRAGLPIWYTEGFNRHPYITFAAPLSLGFEGLAESMDMRLTQDMPMDDLLSRLNAVLPEGLEAYSAGEPVLKAGDIDSSSYRVTFSGETDNFSEFLAQDSIFAQKRSKKGVIRQLELKSFVDKAVYTLKDDGTITMEITLPCGSSENINPMLICEAYRKYLSSQSDKKFTVFCDVLRLDIMDREGHPFK